MPIQNSLKNLCAGLKNAPTKAFDILLAYSNVLQNLRKYITKP